MFRITFNADFPELLCEGYREDYKMLRGAARTVVSTGVELRVSVERCGIREVSEFIVRRVSGRNRVSYESGAIVFSVSEKGLDPFLSNLEFPTEEDLSASGVAYHHHYESLGDVDDFLSADSLPVIFELARL